MTHNRHAIVEFHIAWWFKYYLAGLTFMVQMTQAEPNWQRVEYWTRKAVVMRRIK